MRAAALFMASFALLISANAFAMPSKFGNPEPAYPLGVNAPSIERMARDGADLEGEWNCLVILIDFPDYPWDFQGDQNFPNQDRIYTSEHFNEMMFSEGNYAHPGSESEYTGSMRDYYSEISSGAFTTTGIATNWYRAAEDYSYYCNADSQAGTGDDYGFGEYPNNVQRLVEEAVDAAAEDVDMSLYDNDEDGMVDALFIVHAGPGAEEIREGGERYIWSHKWNIGDREVDGVTVSGYTIEPEGGTIGVFCHEFGHALGLPDLYDTDDSSEGVGEWCLMGGGGWCYKAGDPMGTSPSHMCGWSKMQLEWVNVVNVEENMDDVQIVPIIEEPTLYRLWTMGDLGPEYFLIENRTRMGFDEGLVRRQVEYGFPAPFGLLITHIDDENFSNDNDERRWVDVIEASPVRIGDEYFEQLNGNRVRPDDRNLYNANRGDDGDLWPGFASTSEDSTIWSGDRSRDSFGIFSIPSSQGYDGNPSLVEVNNIRFEGVDVICDLRIDAPEGPLLVISEVEVSDGEGGNGFLEPGETAIVTPHLLNLGRSSATRVSLLLRYVGDLEVTVEPDGPLGVRDIGAGLEAAPALPYRVNIPADAPAIGEIVLVGSANCDQNLSFPIRVTLDLRPPHAWIKHEGGPVLAGRPGEWDSGGIPSFDIVQEGDTLKAWYIGLSAEGNGGGIGYAYSTDFGENWTYRDEPVATQFPDWAETGAISMAVIGLANNYAMTLVGSDANDVATIGIGFSEGELEWEFRDQPIIAPGGWAAEIFPIGQLDFLHDGNQFVCAFAAATNQQFIALGSAFSQDLERWMMAPRPQVLPTLNPETFDGFVVFSPDILFGENGVKMTYCGFSMDFVGRMGEMNVLEGPQFERVQGLETAGATLVADEEGWEAGGQIFGGRQFWSPQGRRILYTVFTEVTGAVGLATEAGAQSVEPETPVSAVPTLLTLNPSYPNPFNGSVSISYYLAGGMPVEIAICNTAGQIVREFKPGIQAAGRHSFVWQTSGDQAQPSGLYYVRISTPYQEAVGKVLLLK